MERANSGKAVADPDAFGRIYAEHRDAVARAAQRIVRCPEAAADVTADVFLTLWTNPGAHDPARGELRPYLVMLARSRALDHVRRQAAARRAQERLEGAATTAPRPARGDRPFDRQARRDLVRALKELPPEQRSSIVLTHLGGASMSEAAAAEHVPLGTTKSRVRLGLARMRVTLGEEWGRGELETAA